MFIEPIPDVGKNLKIGATQILPIFSLPTSARSWPAISDIVSDWGETQKSNNVTIGSGLQFSTADASTTLLSSCY